MNPPSPQRGNLKISDLQAMSIARAILVGLKINQSNQQIKQL